MDIPGLKCQINADSSVYKQGVALSTQFTQEKLEQNINLDVIELAEKDLDFDDIASLLFLVCEEKHSKYIFQRITQFLKINISSTDKCENINYSLIADWCLSNPDNWRIKIIEALAIIECFNVLSNLGYKKAEIIKHFQPYNDEHSICVSLIKKKLYIEFSNLLLSQTSSLFQCMEKVENYSAGFKCQHSIINNKNFEFLLIYLSSESLITFEENNAKLKFLFDLLEKAKLFELKGSLENYIVKYSGMSSVLEISEGMNSGSNDLSTVRHEFDEQGIVNSCKINNMKSKYYSESGNKGRETLNDSVSNYYEIKNTEDLGICLVINQKHFIKYREKDPNLQRFVSRQLLLDRHGTEKDVEKLEETFRNFKISVIVENDVIHSKIESCIKNTIDREFKQHHSLFFLVILSHGEQGGIYGVNSIPIPTSSVVDAVLESYFKLKNIPKIVIVQACQGNSPNPVLETDGSSRSGGEIMPQPNYSNFDCNNKKTTFIGDQKLRTAYHDDLLMCFSTVRGYESYRHTKEGSKYIQILCYNMMKYGHADDFLSICTRVNNDLKKLYVPVEIERGIMIPSTQVSETSSCLHKKLFLVKP